MKEKIKKTLRFFLHRNKTTGIRKNFAKQINGRLANIKDITVDKESEARYLQKWKKFDPNVSQSYYRVYAALSGNKSIDYVPDYLYYTFIEPQLNNYKMSAYGQEKNYYDKLFRNITLPKTLLRNINGINMDRDYNQINLDDHTLNSSISGATAVFIKPTIDTGQGKNVDKFIKVGGEFKNSAGVVLTAKHLTAKFDGDFIVQESLPQCDLLNKLNKDSINTLRILTYRSVKTNQVQVLHTTLRVGKNGSLTDASRTGGRFCGIKADGSFIEKVYDSKGNIYKDFNGVNIENENFRIPNFDMVLQCAKNSAEQIHHHRVLALDVMIDNEDKPRLIEVNPVNQGMFIFQATIGPMFREFTDEVLEYCAANDENYKSSYELKL
ncbi:MAG TPA: sugar-transfer associated ATP-grasp domain-containing protein [Flavobacterium sp.]|jgi:hypothetical protein